MKADTEFSATIERDANGLGIEVDAVDGGVIGAVTPRGDARADGDPRRRHHRPRLRSERADVRSAISGIKGSAGGCSGCSAAPSVKAILKDDVDMQLGPKREWGKISIGLNSNRLVAFQKQRRLRTRARSTCATR